MVTARRYADREVAGRKRRRGTRVVGDIRDVHPFCLPGSNDVERILTWEEGHVGALGDGTCRVGIAAGNQPDLHPMTPACLHEVGCSRRKAGP